MLYRKREMNPQAHTESPMTEMSLTASNNNNDGASGDINPAYNIQEIDHYDVTDDERVGFEPIANNPNDTPPVPSGASA